MRIFKLLLSPLAICIYTGIYYILCLLAGRFWLADLPVHFKLHAAVTAALFALLFLLRGKRYLLHALCMLMFSASFSIGVYLAFSPASPPQGVAKTSLKILQFNVLFKNEGFAKSIPWIIAQDADIVVLQEINETRAKELDDLKAHYKWSQVKLNPKREAFGMAIFSNLPVTKFDYINIGGGWNKYTRTEFMVNNIPFHLYELHTPPPMSRFFFSQRNRALALMGDLLSQDQTPHRILLGDLNTTIYSPFFTDILKKSDMHHAQQGFNMEGTWPSTLPMPLRIGIDHIIASRQVKIESRETQAYHGSDHLPVITKLTLYGDNDGK
jgi:endonuclease/exonuclease/phosphatase (EEP) superfamily protein YafD